MKNVADSLTNAIFRDGMAAYAILDGASIPNLLPQIDKFHPAFICLYRGELKPDIQIVAPYLVKLERGSEFSDWVLGTGWGKHWGVFVVTPADLTAMRQHFRKFLTVHTEAGKPLIFRYYDPRVMRTFLPTCQPGELAQFFGEVQSFVVEGEDPTKLLQFTHKSGTLAKSELPVA